jgi:hypothetical protein
MSGTLFRASGIDANEGAKSVYVWYHDKGSDKYSLLGSGHISASGEAIPGTEVRQYSVAFLLPYGSSVDGVVVTDDKNPKDFLHGVTVGPASGLPPIVATTRDGLLGGTGGIDGTDRPAAVRPSSTHSKGSET